MATRCLLFYVMYISIILILFIFMVNIFILMSIIWGWLQISYGFSIVLNVIIAWELPRSWVD